MQMPATTSLAQWAPRYVRLSAIAAANAAATIVQRRPPAGCRHEYDDEPDRRHRAGDGVTGRERRRRGLDQRARRTWPIDQRLQRTDAQLGRDDGAEERAELQPAPLPRPDAAITPRRSGAITSGPPTSAEQLGDPRQPRRADGDHPREPTVVDALDRRAVAVDRRSPTVRPTPTASSASPAASAWRWRSNIEPDRVRIIRSPVGVASGRRLSPCTPYGAFVEAVTPAPVRPPEQPAARPRAAPGATT